jgi:hypothetical protein
MNKPSVDVLKLPLHQRALIALREAVEGVIHEHALAGRSIFIWPDGKVAEVGPEEIRVLSAKLKGEK